MLRFVMCLISWCLSNQSNLKHPYHCYRNAPAINRLSLEYKTQIPYQSMADQWSRSESPLKPVSFQQAQNMINAFKNLNTVIVGFLFCVNICNNITFRVF